MDTGGWASGAIGRLLAGEAVTIRPRGHSMRGKAEDGDLVHVEPLGDRTLAAGDIVLCKVWGKQYLHLVKAVKGSQYLIGNNRGGVNGWVSRAAIYGIMVR